MTESILSTPDLTPWTGEQLTAIEARGTNLVISASAGSGKTAVLAERVFRLLTEPGAEGEPPPSLGELLIVTFTEKAARQMRERIAARIQAGLMADPTRRVLRRALDDLPGAWIMTLDALCRRIALEHFHRAGISPQGRTPGAPEQAQLTAETIAAWLEAEAGAASAARRAELEVMVRACGDAPRLQAEIRRLLLFLESLDRPGAWIERQRARLRAAQDANALDRLPDAPKTAAAFARATRELAGAFCAAARLAESCGDAAIVARWRRLANDLTAAAAEPQFSPDFWREWATRELDDAIGKIANQGQCGRTIYARTALRDGVLKPLAAYYKRRWRESWLVLDEAGYLQGARFAARQCAWLLEAAAVLRPALAAARARRGWLSFGDVAHAALRVLTDPKAEGNPSDIAHAYRQRFAHVLVDEYQDTSPLQDALIMLLSRADDPTPGTAGNLFLVGDLKQSIYRFRHAEPRIFRGKLECAERSTGAPDSSVNFRALHLRTNFRSRPPILECINACFGRLMSATLGEMEYDEAARLEPSDSRRVIESRLDPVAVEVHWLPRVEDAPEPAAEEGEESAEAAEPAAPPPGAIESQARAVARRLRQLTDPERGLLIPAAGAAGGLHRARPGDCAILVRSLQNERETWCAALEAVGLAARTPGLAPLFSAPELIDLIAALTIADHPFQDIPLAALLRSPLLGFSDDELLRLRLAHRGGAFHETLWAAACAESDLDAPLAAKARRAVEMIDGWRAAAQRTTASEVLERILAETGYAAYLLGRPGGAARLEHLDYLRDQLARHDPAARDGSNPLAAFLATVSRAARDGSDPADLPEPSGDAGDAVNLLTIHKSKGLEFPIVVLPRLERPFHRTRAGDTLLDLEDGMARVGVDVEGHQRFATLAHRQLDDARHRRERSEDLRLLYVAMTRARERLILVGQFTDPEAQIESWRRKALEIADAGAPGSPGSEESAWERLHAASPAQWLGPALAAMESSPEGAPNWLALIPPPPPHVAAPPRETQADVQSLAQAFAAPGEPGAPTAAWQAACQRMAAEALAADSAPLQPPVIRLPPPIDPAAALASLPAKTVVTQLVRGRGELTADVLEGDPRELELLLEEEMRRPYFERVPGGGEVIRPRWAAAEQPQSDAAALGTLTHALLAGVNLTLTLTSDTLQLEARRLREAGLLGLGPGAKGLLSKIHWPALEWFFQSPPGERMRREPGRVTRELPFTVRKSISGFDPGAAATFPTEFVLVQGVIDVVIDEGQHVTILDYKTGRAEGPGADAHRLQIEQYGRALEAIWGVKVDAALIYLAARQIVSVSESMQ